MDKHGCFHSMGKKISFEEFNMMMRQNIIDITKSKDVSGIEISSSVRMLANMFDALSGQNESEKGISGPRMGILMRLMMDEKMGVGEPLTPTVLSEFQNVSKNTISSLIRGLEEQGLVTREIDQKDKRMFRLRITDKGRDLVHEDLPQMAVMMNTLTEVLSTEEKAQLLSLLGKLKMSLIEQAHRNKLVGMRHENIEAAS
jgi:MarR family 2-MHQ and catechol resistance regulon transcriptional repressor